MILALLACGPTEPSGDGDATDTPDVAPEVEPVGDGTFVMTIADTWEGDCDFDDPSTYQPAQAWTFDPRGDVLVLYKDFWSLVACDLAGADFSCDDGSWQQSRMQVTREIEGRFSSETSVEGALVIELDCGGNGCDELQYLYGRRLDFPCRAEAPFSGEAS